MAFAQSSSAGVNSPPVTDAPIGVFDSGVGGLTVARAIIDQLPRESILYVGDTLHSPYGPKPIAEVIMQTVTGRKIIRLRSACSPQRVIGPVER